MLQMKFGDKHGLSLIFHLPSLSRDHGGGSRKYQQSDVTPKGCTVVRVGEERQRFVVPVVYLNHPLFARLLKEAEEEYGFEQEGAITIPCRVDYFRQVRGMIDRESLMQQQQQHNQLFHFHPLHLHLSGCFKA